MLIAAPSEEFKNFYKCDIRYEMADILTKERDCSIWGFLHPVCARDIEVSYSENHPYVFKDNGKDIKGLLPGK